MQQQQQQLFANTLLAINNICHLAMTAVVAVVWISLILFLISLQIIRRLASSASLAFLMLNGSYNELLSATFA